MLVIIRQTAVEVLAVNLQPVEVPGLQEHLQQVLRIRIRRRIDWRQIPTVPPCDILVCPLVGQQQHLRVLFHELRIRVSRQRSPPQFGLQTAFVDLIRDVTHVFVTTGEKLIGVPITFRDLVSVIYVHPGKTEFRYFVQRTQYHVHLERTSVSPCAPNRLECLRLGRFHLHAFIRLHILRERTKCREIVSFVRITECFEATQRIACCQLFRLRQVIVQRHRHLVVIPLPRYRHRDHAEHRLKQTDRHTAVTLP